MDGMTGLDAGERILSAHPDAKILYLTTFADDEYIVKALRIGARGYILKQDFESILPAVKAVYTGQSVFGADIVARIPSLLGKSLKKGSEATESRKRGRDHQVMREGYPTGRSWGRSISARAPSANAVSVCLEKLG
jgi:DNA-binding NarL/FixJ family response regulator